MVHVFYQAYPFFAPLRLCEKKRSLRIPRHHIAHGIAEIAVGSVGEGADLRDDALVFLGGDL